MTVLRARQIRQTDFLLYDIAVYFVLLFGRYSLQLNNKNPYYTKPFGLKKTGMRFINLNVKYGMFCRLDLSLACCLDETN